MPRTRVANSLNDEKMIDDGDEEAEDTPSGEEGHGLSSTNSGALSLQGRRQGTMTGEEMD